MRLEWVLDAARAGTSRWVCGNAEFEWDRREREIFGFAENDRVSIDALMARVHPDDRREIYERMEKLILPGEHDDWNHEFRIIHPVLGLRWIAGRGRVQRDASGQCLVMAGINFDITERKQAEQALQEWSETLAQQVAERTRDLSRSEARFRQLAEASFEGVVVSDDGIVLDCNLQAAEMFGYGLAEVIGRPLQDFVAPESRAVLAQRIREGSEEAYTFTGLRKDGSTFPGEAQGRMRIWMGTASRVSAIRDLTRAKQAEAALRAMQTELEEAQRLASVAEISAGIIHQISQPLTCISVNFATCLAKLARCDLRNCGGVEAFSAIGSDIALMRDAVTQLRSLYRPGQSERLPLDCNTFIGEILHMLQPEAANRQCRLVAEFGADLPPVLANAVQMKQVIQNLVRNAFDACADCPPERQVVTVTTRALDGEGVELCVHDAGTGIPQSVASRLFERFCTTKPDGLGIGLCLCRTIVRAHGGTLAGSNNPDGPGATFRMVLPSHRASSAGTSRSSWMAGRMRRGI